MTAIQFTDRGTAVRISPCSKRLAQAALAALDAPSIFNTQPWRWRIDDTVAELRADRSRQLRAVDPDGRLLTLSCGVALHHARVALAAEGVDAEVVYRPDAGDPDLIATLRWRPPTEATPLAHRLRRAMVTRRTDRRPFAEVPVPDAALERLADAAHAAGAHLHFPPAAELVEVAVAAGHAASVELADPAYREELAAWRDRPGGDGVPTATTVAASGRPVPVRDFTATGRERATIHDTLDPADRQARYGVLYTGSDGPRDWIAAGEALSAVLLTATAEGLATSVMSDLVEVPATRLLLQRTLRGVGYPAVVVRVGVAGQPEAPKAPRRYSAEMVEVVSREVS